MTFSVLFFISVVHLCDIHGQHRGHHTLPLIPDSQHGFCIFSVIFSQDNKEILGGSASVQINYKYLINYGLAVVAVAR